MTTYKIQETETEQGFTVTYTRTCIIEEKKFYNKDYQTERWYRNGQLLNTAQYPAGTDYANGRLAGMTQAA